MDGTTLGILAGAAFLAGVMNAVAGGGTLLTFPALSGVISLAAANATSTVALLPGSLAGAWGYRQSLRGMGPFLKLLLPPSLAGGLLGSLLVIAYPEDFGRLVPWLILTAATLFLIQQPVNQWLRQRRHMATAPEAPPDRPEPDPVLPPKPPTHRGHRTGLILFQFLTATYGGYFGAGIGILMLTALGFMNLGNIHRMNAVKTVLASTINLVTVLVFLVAQGLHDGPGLIHAPLALLMAVTSTLGGYAGARVAQRLPVVWVRSLIIVLAFGLAAYYFLT